MQGNLLLSGAGKPAAKIWLVAVAYNNNEQIVGFRRWEWSGSLQPGATQEFSLPVYSLGAAISHVEVIVEARP